MSAKFILLVFLHFLSLLIQGLSGMMDPPSTVNTHHGTYSLLVVS